MENDPTLSLGGAEFNTTDTLWILISAALVFFMQAGFKVLETGLVKDEHRSGIGIKNLMDWVAGSLAFFIIGFGLMFGKSAGGFIGTDLFFGLDQENGYSLVFFIFQLAFAGTALTIVSGAMSGRTGLAPYFVASFFTAILIYPVFGHWAWGNLLNPANEPWLAKMGFMDFAGSTVVHSVGAWVGLVGIYMVGPRLGRYTAKGVVVPTKASDYAYSVLGLMILWFGWWGFNGGSTLAFDASVPLIILNTNLAAAAACLSAYAHAKFAQKNTDIIEKIIGGTLTGLVAITACCNVVSPQAALLIGILAGIIHNYAFVFIIEKLKLDDPVGAIPVHGFGGIFGTLCVALFGKQELLANDRWTQLGVQVVGILACFFFTAAVSYVIFYCIRATIGLRMSPQEEKEGSVFSTVVNLAIEDLPEQQVSQVSVRMGDRAYNLFKVEEYLNLPRETRMNLIKNDGVQYLDDSGNIVPTLKAVRFLAGILEKRGSKSNSVEEPVELAMYNQSKEVIGSLQDVLIGDSHSISSVFEDSFVLMKVKDKVSSSFYWHGQEKGYKVLIVGSCNIPDISNAFISALAISQLNEIVGMKKILPPEKILTHLDSKLRVALFHSSPKAFDLNGLDMGVMLVDNVRRKVYYSGSGLGIKMYAKKLGEEVTELKGIDLPLGKGDKQFERVKMDYTRGDSFYMGTLGLINQINEGGSKFSENRLKEMINKNAARSIADQKITFESEYAKWLGKENQTEDILFIGLKP